MPTLQEGSRQVGSSKMFSRNARPTIALVCAHKACFSAWGSGTPAIAQCIGLGAACDYLSEIGMDRIYEWECLVSKYLFDKLHSVAGWLAC